jgi:chorismate mutase
MTTTTTTATTPTDDLRAEIDALDAELVALVERRRQVSRRIQAERVAAGGPRIVHAREAEVVGRWRQRLGAPGGRIALALLELSRGAVV